MEFVRFPPFEHPQPLCETLVGKQGFYRSHVETIIEKQGSGIAIKLLHIFSISETSAANIARKRKEAPIDVLMTVFTGADNAFVETVFPAGCALSKTNIEIVLIN